MIIISPTHSADEPEYDFECQQALGLAAIDLIDQAGQAGWQSEWVHKALAEIVGNQIVVDEIHADPAGESHRGRINSGEKLVANFISGRLVPEA